MRQHVMEEADAARQPTPGIPTANRLGGGTTARGGRWQHRARFPMRRLGRCGSGAYVCAKDTGPCLPQRGVSLDSTAARCIQPLKLRSPQSFMLQPIPARAALSAHLC